VESQFENFKNSSIAVQKEDFVEKLQSAEPLTASGDGEDFSYWVNITADSPDGGKSIDEIEAEIN